MKSQGQLLRNARDLRKNGTDAELLLWRNLRQYQVEGIKFKRQQPIENYIVDFVAFGPKLVVELDGSQHADCKHYDEKRDACLRSNGFTVLRFWNNEIMENMTGVLEVIRLHCLRSASPSPQPPPARGGGVL